MRLSREALRATALALALGVIGGALFKHFQMPLAWMLGAMTATTIGAFAGLEMVVPDRMRGLMIGVLGVMVGTAFSPELLARLVGWLGGVALLAVFIVVVSACIYLYFRRVAGFDPTTAYFSSTPGGLTVMVIIGEAMGGDSRAIALVQSVRVLAVVSLVPLYFRLVEGVAAPVVQPVALGLAITPTDALSLTAGGVIGFLVAAGLRIPAAPLVGPMAVSAALHIAGFSEARVPTLLIAMAQIVVGTTVGCRFVGFALAQVWRTLLLALGSSLIMIVFAAGTAWIAGSYGIASPAALFLALAPGGLAEMSLVALGLGIDAAFVTTMHVVRIVFVVVAAPLVFAWPRRRRRAGAEP